MSGGLEKIMDSAENVMEKAPQIPETSDRIPSMDDLRERLAEVFPVPSDTDGGRKEAIQDAIKPYPKEVVLDDGSVVTLPDPFPRSAADGRGETNPDTRDGSGKPGLTEKGDRIPNNTCELDGKVYKTDDHGNIYSEDGKLFPNNTYELNGTVYQTDEYGRIIQADARPELTPENPRDNDAQKNAGGKDRQEGDQGGHIIGRDMGGDGGEGNLVAMDANINQSDYKRMENDIKRAKAEGKDVEVHAELSYSGDSERPDTIKVTVTADGKETVYTFDNNTDGALREKAAETGGKDGAETVQSVLGETGGEVSSIKEEYGENGSLAKVTVNVTYTDDTGKTMRTKIVIDNPQGGTENA